jgi:cytochrome c1
VRAVAAPGRLDTGLECWAVTSPGIAARPWSVVAALAVAAGVLTAAVGAWPDLRRLVVSDRWSRAATVTGGDPARGRELVLAYGCGYCHLVPGLHQARGLVGPSLEHMASRVYVAGMVPNTPRALERWLRDPPTLAPGTAMPNLGVTPRDARDLAAFLYTLE